MAINQIPVISDGLSAWGVNVVSYEINGEEIDFQDLLIRISEQRAATVETEIKPMSTRMSTRNKKLDDLGEALAIIADVQGKITDTSKDSEGTSDAKISDAAARGLAMVGLTVKPGEKLTLKKSVSDYYQQLIKTKLDSYNNASNKDMTRLQSLVDKRDESYSTATSLMQAVADTRSNTIKNM